MKLLLLILLALPFLTCGEPDPSAKLGIGSHGCNFIGNYILDGKRTIYFEGSETGYSLTNNYVEYAYSKEFDEFKSILINITKLECACSLSVALWVRGRAVVRETSPAYDQYDEVTGICKTTVDPIYYEWEYPEVIPIDNPTNPIDDGMEGLYIYD